MFAIHQLLSSWSCLVGQFIGTQGSIRCEHIKYISHVVCCVWLIEYIRSHGLHLVGQYIWISNVRGPVMSSELVPFRYVFQSSIEIILRPVHLSIDICLSENQYQRVCHG